MTSGKREEQEEGLGREREPTLVVPSLSYCEGAVYALSKKKRLSMSIKTNGIPANNERDN